MPNQQTTADGTHPIDRPPLPPPNPGARPYKNLTDLKEAHARQGGKFFSPQNMRLFKTTVLAKTFTPTAHGALFITHDRHGYALRYATLDTDGTVDIQTLNVAGDSGSGTKAEALLLLTSYRISGAQRPTEIVDGVEHYAYRDISAVRADHAREGCFFFSKGAMDYAKSIIYPNPFVPVTTGAFFLTSELLGPKPVGGEPRRVFHIRHATQNENGPRIKLIEPDGKTHYATKELAAEALWAYVEASGAVRVYWPKRPAGAHQTTEE
jgi:hypothetical protein